MIAISGSTENVSSAMVHQVLELLGNLSYYATVSSVAGIPREHFPRSILVISSRGSRKMLSWNLSLRTMIKDKLLRCVESRIQYASHRLTNFQFSETLISTVGDQ